MSSITNRNFNHSAPFTQRCRTNIFCLLLSAALLQLALPQVSFAAPASGANVQGLDNKADATASPSSDSEDSLTAQADSLYWQGKYQDALPLYFKLANLGSSNGGKICDSPMKL